MKTIGLLGGMSWESSAEYYRLANVIVRERLGGFHSAPLLLDSVDFADIQRMQVEDRWDDAGRLLAAHAEALQAGGADLLALCTNTMHKVAETIQSSVAIPFLHIGDTTAAAVQREGLTCVGLLATAYTMEQPFLRDWLAAAGLEVLVPDSDDRAAVHRIIYEELVLGVVRDESRAALQDVIEHLVAHGADGVILGCTEIELLIAADDSPVPVFPTTRIHIEAAVDAALATT